MSRTVFRRKLYDKMLQWKDTQQGATALLVKGARRVGKSTLVAEFARKEYASCLIIDFSNASPEVSNLFNDVSDIDLFFFRLQALTRVKLARRKSVVVLDEIQLSPKARQAVKHLVADGRYDYIETGSLLSIKKNVAGIVIPSEETRMTLHPLDFEEFRWALGDELTMPMLRQVMEQHKSLGDALNRALMRHLRLYMTIGGMPQAVKTYLETNNMERVDQVKRNILELYDDDFRKIDATGRLSLIFRSIPGELSRNASRYSVSNAIPGARGGRMLEAIAEMADSMTVNVAYHSNDPSVGLALTKDLNRYKMYVADTGLFITLAFMDKDFASNTLYAKLLNDKLRANLGYVYENMVAQMLRAAGDELFYFTFPRPASNHLCEIDFLLSRGEKICPVEVKSSGYKTHASLDAFCARFSERILHKYVLYTKDLRREGDVHYLPVYLTSLL